MDNQAINKDTLKAVLEEMLRERNPELKGFLEELLLQFLAAKPNTDTAPLLDMEAIRDQYALRRDAFSPLHTLFQDAPAAAELVKMLHK